MSNAVRPVRRLIELTLELHAELDAGRGDGDRADEIREEMDDFWEKVPDLARKNIGNLSGALNDERRRIAEEEDE